MGNGNVEWGIYRSEDGIDMLTTREARAELDIEGGRTIVADGVLALGTSSDGEGFLILGFEAELREWLARAERLLNRTVARNALQC